MYCSKCGNEIQPDEKRCLSCGSEVVSDETAAESEMATVSGTAAESETASVTPNSAEEMAFEPADELTAAAAEIPNAAPALAPKTPKRRRFKVLVIAIPVVILLLAAAVWAAASAGLFLSPKQYYMMIEAKNYVQKAAEMDSLFKNSVTELKALSSGKPSSYDTKFGVTIDEKDIPEESAKLVSFLNTLKIHYNLKTNPNELQAVQNIGFSLKDNELLGLNLYLDKTKLYADVPALLDKYFYIDLQNIKAVFENLGIDATSVPESLTEEDIRKLMGLDNKQDTKGRYAAVLQKYAKLYYDSIPDKCISLEKGSTLEIEGRNIKCGKLSVKFSQEQFKEFLLSFTSALKEDEELYNLLNENMKQSQELMKKYNSLSYTGVDLTYDRDKFKEMIGNLEDMIKNDLTMPDGITMILWVNNGDIVKRNIETAFGSGTDKVGMVLETSGIKAADSKYKTHAAFDISNKGSDSKGEKIGLEYKGSRWTGEGKTNFSNGEVKLLTNIQTGNAFNFDLRWDSEVKGDNAAKTISTKYDMSFSDGGSGDQNFRLNGEFRDNASENAKLKTFKDDITLSAYYMPAGENQGKTYGGKLQLAMERAYDIDFKLPAFDSGKIVDLGKVDGNGLYEVASEAGMSLVGLINKNPWLNDYTDFSSLGYLFGGMD